MQICVHLPEELAVRLRAAVPARERSAFIADLLRRALPQEDDPLYRIARAVEEDAALAAEMADWDVTAADGLGGGDAPR
ncbi:hypothetical protein DFW101_1839 [Solidesulfovibrio carbinoliphilus subsp. oakridgensis]|uniref:Uncharacterized protein n=1 Tax=Solidesulfovibrio carbinoliphilus subsp. oakridgensis TaxID=694327 RepID=G7QA16_9BACT|nr:hypothetical protein [Solidesulfovibrio carbinoliphilus]EHJ47846.1 hypothetical protein DFW101_1839 [Solidesulfovibrio carbinoliphilus subsp. oakridgensis]